MNHNQTVVVSHNSMLQFYRLFLSEEKARKAAKEFMNQQHEYLRSRINDPGYDAWTNDYWRESVVTMEKDTLWQEIYETSE